jgi:hypothetical protein
MRQVEAEMKGRHPQHPAGAQRVEARQAAHRRGVIEGGGRGHRRSVALVPAKAAIIRA